MICALCNHAKEDIISANNRIDALEEHIEYMDEKIKEYKNIIKNHFNLLLTEKRFKSVTMIADVDSV